MWIAMQLVEVAQLLMIGAQIAQEVTYRSVVATNRIRAQGGSDRIDGPEEEGCQRMPDWTAAVPHG
jgi:hypothetical protein